MLRILILISTLAATTWGGIWLLKSRAWEADLTTWMEDRRADGWQADWGTVEVRGFPNRLDTTISDLALADTEAGWAWTAPFLQIFSLVYRPQEVILALPEDTVLQTPRNRYRLHGDEIRASLSLDRDADLALERITAVLDGVGLTREGGETWRAAQMRLAAERKATNPAEYRLGLALSEVIPPPGVGPEGARAALQADVTMRFDAAWDRSALESARPQPAHLQIDRATISWAELEIRAAGTLDISESGTPEGQVTLQIVNWRDVLDLSVETGALPRDLAGPIRGALELASRLAGRPDTLDVPLDLRRGRIFLGPIPVGEAPRLHLR